MYSDYEIRQLCLSVPRQRSMVEAFLQGNALRLDDVDYYAGVFAVDSDEMLAGGGLSADVIKCLAVRPDHRDGALASRLVSHLVSRANAEGRQVVKVFTKPSNKAVFQSMSFRLLAEAPEAVLMETGLGGIGAYCRYLEGLRRAAEAEVGGQPTGVVVMNANPFTLGHRYLISRAAARVARLYVIVVAEEASLFGYGERMAMIKAAVADIDNVVVCRGSSYAVSRATFPTYFLKRITDAADTQMMLDIDLFCRHIAPALGTTVRFVGSEPTDALTCRYNELMKKRLGSVVEVQRLAAASCPGGAQAEAAVPVSASRVRAAMQRQCFAEAAALVPPTTLPYIIARLATQALQAELDATPKPGLVDRRDNGAHTDMDYALMCRSISALHPFFLRLAQMGFAPQLPPHAAVAEVGQEAERAMFAATGGVNTHKGALFALGLAVVAAAHEAFVHGSRPLAAAALQQSVAELAAQFPDTSGTHGSEARRKAAAGVGQGARPMGALANARGGYAMLFGSWLPFYSRLHRAADPYALHRTLLHIMCGIDDTNILFRTDAATALMVKREASALLGNFSDDALCAMNARFVERNISPGGSADMLSLTMFVFSMCNNQSAENAKKQERQ